MTYEQIILSYLEDLRRNDPSGGWKREYEIRCMDTKYGWIGARGDRTVRDLIKAGRLEAKKEGVYRIVRSKTEPRIFPPAFTPQPKQTIKLFN